MFRMFREYSNAGSYIVFTVSFILLYYFTEELMNWPDTGWHIFVGDYMRENRQFPVSNFVSHTAPYVPWLNISWVFDLILSYLHHFTGPESLIFFSNAIVALTIMIVFENVYKRGVSVEVAFIATFLCGFIMINYSAARPHIISFFFLAIFHRLLHESREKGTGKLIIVLPLLTAIWANFHGGFLAGFILIGAYGLEAVCKLELKRIKHLFFTGVLNFGAIFCTPLGLDMPDAMTKAYGSIITPQILEWQPISFTQNMSSMLFIALFFLVSNLQYKEIPLADKILTIAWIFLAMDSRRHLPIMGMIAAPYIAISIQRFQKERNEELEQSIHSAKQKLINLSIGAVLCSVLIIFSYSILSKEKLMNKKPFHREESTKPVVDFILENYPDHTTYNPYGMGGEMIYYSDGALKVFVDGRAGTAYTEEILKAFLDISFGAPNWYELLEEYDINLVTTNTDASLITRLELTKEWKEVYKDDYYVIYIKKEPWPEKEEKKVIPESTETSNQV